MVPNLYCPIGPYTLYVIFYDVILLLSKIMWLSWSIIWDVMQWNIILFVIKLCHMDHLHCTLYRIIWFFPSQFFEKDHSGKGESTEVQEMVRSEVAWLLVNTQVDSQMLHRTPGLSGGSRRTTGKKRRNKGSCFRSCNCCKGCLLCCIMLKNLF